MDEKSIRRQLADIFAAMGQRGGVVCWRDAAGEFEDLAPDLELEGVEVLREVPGEEFLLKRRLNALPLGSRVLLYRGGNQASSFDWLADIEALAVPFGADYASALLRDLNATDTPQMREALDTCRRLLAGKRTLSKLKALSEAYHTPQQLLRAALAVCLGSASSDASSIVVARLRGGEKGRGAIERAGLGDALAVLLHDCCGYVGDRSDEDALLDHVLAVAASSTLPIGVAGVRLGRDVDEVQRHFCHEVFERWLLEDRVGLRSACVESEERLGMRDALGEAGTGALLWCDVFPVVDAVLLGEGLTELASPDCDPAALLSVADVRSCLAWGDEFDACYRGLVAGARLRIFQDTHRVAEPGSVAVDVWNEYLSEWHAVDRWYREFRAAADEVAAKSPYGLDVPFGGVVDAIENLYKEWYLRALNARWCSCIEADLGRGGEVEGIARQVDFYQAEVEGAANRCKRAWVIVSDALRYEVGAELADRLKAGTRGSVDLAAVQAALPTKTKVGMPALLPHGSFAASAGLRGGLAVLVDGAETRTTLSRQAALRRYSSDAVAVRHDDFVFGNDRAGRRDLVGDAEVIYIYHNAIDAVGDSAQTERKVFGACADTVSELEDLVKLLVREFRASEVLVTADHGFLYTAKPLGQSEHVGGDSVDGRVVEASRRYVVAHGGASSELLVPARLPGKEGLVAFFPRECVRLRMPGDGENYVHGGISLQEMCVPVLRFKNHRAGSKGYVEAAEASLSLVTQLGTVTAPTFVIELLQDEAVGGKVLPADYEVYVADAAGGRVTSTALVRASSRCTDPSARVHRARLRFLSTVPPKEGGDYSLVARSTSSHDVTVLCELVVRPEAGAPSPWLV